MDEILQICADYHGVDRAAILRHCNARFYVTLRHEFFWLAYWAGWTETEIHNFARFDHSSINHARSKIVGLIKCDIRIRRDLSQLQELILEHFKGTVSEERQNLKCGN
jgi:hypothetical protein